MQNHPIRFGIYAGGMVVLLNLILYFVDKTLLASVSSLIEFVVVIFFMTKAVSATNWIWVDSLVSKMLSNLHGLLLS